MIVASDVTFYNLAEFIKGQTNILNMEIYFKNREEWRRWLGENGNSNVDGIWMMIYKKHTGKECIQYNDAVEEALCYGWIDGKIKRINDDYYIQRYTRRRHGSRWSRYNIERVEKLKKENMMTPAGIEAYNEIFENPKLVYDNRRSGDPVVPGDLLAALEQEEASYNNFIEFPPSARRLYIEWLNSAKRDETRMNRIKKIVLFSKQNKRPGMM